MRSGLIVGIAIVCVAPRAWAADCSTGTCAVETLGDVVDTAVDRVAGFEAETGIDVEHVGERLDEIFSDMSVEFHEDRLLEVARAAVASDDKLRVKVDIVITAQEIDTLTDGVWHFLMNTSKGRKLYEETFSAALSGGPTSLNAAELEHALEKVLRGYRTFNRGRRQIREAFPELAALERVDVEVWYNEEALRCELRSLVRRLANHYFLTHEFLPRIRPRARRPGTRLNARVTRRRSRRRQRQVNRPNSIYNRILGGELNKINTRELVAALDSRADHFLERAEADRAPTRTIDFHPVCGDLHNHHNGWIGLRLNSQTVLTVSSPGAGVVSGADLVRGAQMLAVSARYTIDSLRELKTAATKD